jgi:outer membrane immunogenic protein
MKKIVTIGGAFIVLATAQSAWAADLAPIPYYKAPPPPPVLDIGSGFYAGVNLGYGWGYDPFSMSTVSGAGYAAIPGPPVGTPLYTNYGNPVTNTLHDDGWNGGGQIGYNRQLAPEWVAGIEADLQGGDMSGGVNCLLACGTPLVIVNPPIATNTARVIFSDISAQDKLDWFGTVRGRFGYTPWSSALLYVTGGLAYGEVERSGRVAGTSTNTTGTVTYNTFAGSYDNSSTRIGWTLGGGVEEKLSPNWSVKAEYLYIDLGSVTDTFNTIYQPGSAFGTPGTVAGVRTDSSTFRENVFRVGLNYLFK